MSERERYSADDAKEIGEVVEMCAPRFADWYHNGTLSSQRGNAKTKELARAFECRLQNYVNRKERLNGGDVIRGSVVYVVGNSEKASVCKVGTTTNPEKRFSALQVGFPWQLRVYKMYRGEGPRFEYRIHQLLDDERIRGEWFKFNEAVKEVIEPRRSVPIGELDLERWFS